MVEAPEYISVPQAAKMCGIGRTTMWKWVKSHKIKALVTPGGHHRILRKDVQNFIEVNAATGKGRPRKNTILIVDDDPAMQRTMTRILERHQFNVETASDGFEAGKKVATLKPDLVILDLFMPGIDGFEVCRTMKGDEQLKSIKVLAMTGFDTPENEKRILAAGADAYLAKDTGPHMLISEISALL